MIRRQRAESVAFDFKRAIESRPVVLESHCRSQFNDLLGAELVTDVFEHAIRNIGWCARHRFGIAQHQSLAAIEIRAGLEVRELFQLDVRYSGFSATGRVDVHSEWTSDHLRDPSREHKFETSL